MKSMMAMELGILQDRLCNDQPHNSDNIQPCCATCNVMKSNRSTNL